LAAALQGDLRKVMSSEWKTAGRAIRAGLREAGKGLQADLRRDAESAGLPHLGKVWRVRVYRGKRGPAESAALVYPKGGDRTRGALWAFENGATIRAEQGRYMLIPTQFNRKSGRRGGRVLFEPSELQGSFVRRSRDGTLLLFARVSHAQSLVRGKVRDRAYVNDRMVGSGRVKRTREILEKGAVPMFVLVPQIRVRKRLDIAGMRRRWEGRTAELIVKHWRNASGR
jgi:hypothetical protein